MTFLFQRKGQSGLELCPGRKISTEFGYGDTWVPVDVEEGAIVINVGSAAFSEVALGRSSSEFTCAATS